MGLSKILTRPQDSLQAAHRFAQRHASRFLVRRGFTVSEARYSAPYLRRYGFDIQTFVDVGVFKGTPVFYEIFKDKKLVLIDPMPSARSAHEALRARGLDADFIEVAAGSTAGEAILHDTGPSSSLLERRDGIKQTTSQSVRVDTLDNLVQRYAGPIGLKIDTEGFDLEVIRGAAETLKRTEFVFSEVSLRHRFNESYKFSEFIAEMASHGFEVAEIIPHPGHNRYADVLFVQAGSRYLEPDAVKARRPGQRFAG